MKKKLNGIWGIGLVVVLAASLLMSATPISAADLGWNEFKLPSNSTTSNVILGLPIVDFAVADDGTTVYAVDGANQRVYMSTNGGETWSRKNPTNMPAAPDLVAVAPDDPDLVAVVDGTSVFASTDGLSNLSDLTVTGFTTINALTVSPDTSGKHYIIVGGVNAGVAAIAAYNLGATVPSWDDLAAKTGFDGVTNVAAVACSPSFASDFTLAAITEDDTAGNDLIRFELYSFASGNKKWNDDAGTWADYDGTKNRIVDAAGASPLVAADIALAMDYYGGDEALRIAFVGLDTGVAAEDGVFRMNDDSHKNIQNEDIYSVAFDGTSLVAGSSGSSVVYRSSDPLASSPSFAATSTFQKPSGQSGMVKVRWSGPDVFAISQGNEGGFSVSEDNGKSFNDISLINTALTDLQSIAVSSNGDIVWAITDDTADMSVWRKASRWERVLSYTTASDYIVKLAPADTDVVYLGQSGGTSMFVSSDGGEAKWFSRNAGVTLVDFTIEDSDVCYAIDSSGDVSKSTNNGFTWGSSKATGIGSGASIVSLGEDMVLASGTGASKVAWSSDGNSSWTKTDKDLSGGGNAVVAASGLSDGDFIYAATSEVADTAAKVERWEIGESTSWKNLSVPTTADLDNDATNETYGAYGIALVNGTLYVLGWDNATVPSNNSALFRSINPTADTVSWSTIDATDKDHDGSPISTNGGNALSTSEGSTNIWAIESATEQIFYWIDTVSIEGPSLAGPGNAEEVQVNPVSGGTYTISFTWDRLSKAEKYDLQISLDSSFNEKVLQFTGAGTNPAVESTSATVAKVVDGAIFMPETTYYWRVRMASDGPVYSPWSETRSFTVAALPEAQPPVIVQAPGPAPVIEVPPTPEIILEAPEIVLPAPTPAPEIVIPAAPPPAAPPIPAWAIYAIIIIGAVLVIALIVLIMRTRRPV